MKKGIITSSHLPHAARLGSAQHPGMQDCSLTRQDRLLSALVQTVAAAMSLSCRSLPLLACVSLLFGACASAPPAREEKVTPPAVFKAHPGLLGQAARPKSRPLETPTKTDPDPAQKNRAAPADPANAHTNTNTADHP
jgi:hypothetical protein